MIEIATPHAVLAALGCMLLGAGITWIAIRPRRLAQRATQKFLAQLEALRPACVDSPEAQMLLELLHSACATGRISLQEARREIRLAHRRTVDGLCLPILTQITHLLTHVANAQACLSVMDVPADRESLLLADALKSLEATKDCGLSLANHAAHTIPNHEDPDGRTD